MLVRNYQDSDFSQLEALLRDTGLFYGPIDRQEILKKKIDIDPESIIVAEESGKIIGTVFIIYDPWNSFVYHLGVHPDHRNQGLGGTLMNEAEKRLKSRGIEEPTLFVIEDNEEVVEFYKKRGWFVSYKVFCMGKNL